MKLSFKNCFTMNFNNMDFYFPKDTISFKHGYGIVKARYEFEITEEDKILYADEPLIGIIDKHYHKVMELFPAFKLPLIEIFDNSNFVVKRKDSDDKEGNDYSVYIANIDNGNLVIQVDLSANNFTRINDTTIMLDSIVSKDGCHLYALYNVVNKELLTPYFYYIGPFHYDSEYETEVADAVYVVQDSNDELVKIGCIINKNGEAAHHFWNIDTGVFYDFPELQDVIEFVMNGNRTR